jgi:hypothetical protein
MTLAEQCGGNEKSRRQMRGKLQSQARKSGLLRQL